ncbi:MAG TPA: hypothetical protein VF640_07050, partial [Acidimicrobiales bacterium]
REPAASPIAAPAAAALAHVPAPPPADPNRPGPFALADGDRLRSLLAGAGLVDVALDEVRAPARLGGSVGDALAFLGRSELARRVIDPAPPDAAARAWAAVEQLLAASAGDDGAVVLSGSAWLVSARRPA